jgi:hypothetical protein
MQIILTKEEYDKMMMPPNELNNEFATELVAYVCKFEDSGVMGVDEFNEMNTWIRDRVRKYKEDLKTKKLS